MIGLVPPDRAVLTLNKMVPKIDVRSFPNARAHMRIAFASDLHARRGMRISAIADKIAGLHADALLLGGDIADRAEYARSMLGALQSIAFPMGAFAVCGNNDIEAFGSRRAFGRALREFGIRLLVNEGVFLAGANVYLGGVDEAKYGFPDPLSALSGAPRGAYRILMSHYPLSRALAARPNLMLSGHTHGGQFNFLGITPYAIGMERRYRLCRVSGMGEHAGAQVLVSRGVGASRIPLRIGVRSEIHLIQLGKSQIRH